MSLGRRVPIPERFVPSHSRVHPGVFHDDESAWLVLAFDLGELVDLPLACHGVDLFFGLLLLREWAGPKPVFDTLFCTEFDDAWWEATFGPAAFAARARLSAEPDLSYADLGRCVALVDASWSFAYAVLASGRDLPDALVSFVAPAYSIVTVDARVWFTLLESYRDGVLRPVPPFDDPIFCGFSHAHVCAVLGDGAVQPWARGDRPCVFRCSLPLAHARRVYVVVEDTVADGSPDRAFCAFRSLLGPSVTLMSDRAWFGH